tara:strand:+ start:1003 stop:1476 length:474 start_codon:yes stop_codon:yes gene_type:complete
MKYYLILLSILTLASAQHWGSPPGGGPDRDDAKMIKKWKLIEFLDISEDQSDKFFTRVNSFEKEMKSFRKKEKELRESIQELLEEDRLNKKKVSSLMGEYFDLEKEKLALRQKHHEGIGDILTLEQTAKYLVFDHHFKKRIKDHLNNRKGAGRRNRF